MFVIFLSIISLVFIFRNKKESLKNKLVVGSINTAFIMYMLDFFLMPFAYQIIDIEKLPFHICTVSCVLCFLSRHNNFFNKYNSSVLKYRFSKYLDKILGKNIKAVKLANVGMIFAAGVFFWKGIKKSTESQIGLTRKASFDATQKKSSFTIEPTK